MATPPLSEQLRELVRSSGLSMLAVARGAEIDKGQLSRFLSGQGWLGPEPFDRLGSFLGLRLVARRPASRNRRTKR